VGRSGDPRRGEPRRRPDGFIFPGDIEDWPICDMAMLMCLRRLKGDV
jgi:hypothetical protein